MTQQALTQARPFKGTEFESFLPMCSAYFTELLDKPLPQERLAEIARGIWEQAGAGILRLDLLEHGGEAAGFAIYQIDTPQSDWCERVGWGFIREVYVRPSARGRGLGRFWAQYLCAQLTSMGARGIYLTADDAQGFWQACGFELSTQTAHNDVAILEKR